MYGLGGHLPDILWDGYVNKERKVDGKAAGPGICIDNGQSHVLNADGPGGYKNPVDDAAPFKCSLPKLPAVVLARHERSRRRRACMSAVAAAVGVLPGWRWRDARARRRRCSSTRRETPST
jgi:hypothetical protein